MHLTKIKLVWTTTALLILNLNGINTQSDTAQAATEKLDLATMSLDSVQNPTTSVIDVNKLETVKSSETHNMNNTTVDTEKINSNETPIKQNSYAKLERPYSVIMPIKANPVNDKASPNKSNTATTKHKVEKLEVKDIETLMQNNIHHRNNINNTVAEELIGRDHPCRRKCIEGEAPMICHYHFILEWYETMSKACYDCPFNETDCSRPDCIPADGVKRPLNVVNRKLPGPVIEICKYDRVIVDVENDLIAEGTTVHWHGQHQKGTPHMDGTPHVTQCSIPPKTTFRYQFNASHSGTHFWHSHSGMQRGDGAAGAFIVRKPKSLDPHGWMYDYDRSDHVMLITDWSHVLLVGMFTSYHHTNAKSDDKPPTLLINGKGRFRVFNNDTEQPKYMRAARFNVERGYKYRFRLINAEFLNCPIELSVDGHNITVISSDGYNLKPIIATSLVTYAGERYDFVLEANAGIDNYWIRYKGHMDCDERFKKAKQVAVLHYEGALDSEPPGDPTWEELHNEGLQLNALNKGEEDNETISIAEMEALEGWDESLKEVADHQFYVVYDLYPKNNPHYHRSPYYEFYQVPDIPARRYTPQLNHISMRMPSSPFLISRPSPETFCNSSSIDDECKAGYCECPHVLSVKLNSIVEVVIIDEGNSFDANHPFHLHGHSFRVVGLRKLATNTSLEEIQKFDKDGFLKRNLKNAPRKDTVTVPDGGYTVIRFKADNPGYWLFHCHIEFHSEIGMALVFKVGEHKDMMPTPKDFPRCGNYIKDNLVELVTTEKPNTDSFSIKPAVIANTSPTSSASSSTVSMFLILFIYLSLLK